jgi:malate synthase
MEDAATAEICRAQVWQWVRHGARMNDGRTITAAMVKEIIRGRTAELQSSGPKTEAPRPDRRLQQAADLLDTLMTGKEFPEFLTLASYDLLD